MSTVQFWCWVLVACCALGIVAIHAMAWWREFKFKSRVREYMKTGTWTDRWWR